MFATEHLVELRQRIDRLEAEFLDVLAEYDRSREWEVAGYISATAALRQLCRMDGGRAASAVALARKASSLPETPAVLAQGEISRSHLQAIADAYTPERTDTLAPLESEFVDVARKCTRRELRNVVRYATDALDGDGGAATDTEQHARRRWHMSRTFDGLLRIDAQFTGLDAEYWETAINAEMERDRVAQDPRTPAQWRADAATNIVRRSLDDGTIGNIREVRPHVTVVVDMNDLPDSAPELIDAVRAERRYPARCHGRCSTGSCATAKSTGWWRPASRRCSTLAGRVAPRPGRNTQRSWFATAAATLRVAMYHQNAARPTTEDDGAKAALLISPTSNSSAGDTTAKSTATRSSGRQTKPPDSRANPPSGMMRAWQTAGNVTG
jgi:hypothetical protein